MPATCNPVQFSVVAAWPITQADVPALFSMVMSLVEPSPTIRPPAVVDDPSANWPPDIAGIAPVKRTWPLWVMLPLKVLAPLLSAIVAPDVPVAVEQPVAPFESAEQVICVPLIW